MLLRAIFAANLTRLCKQQKSIAQVCRATGINRQQMNKYLAGDLVPREATRARLCSYFGVSDRDLFEEARPSRTYGPKAPLSTGAVKDEGLALQELATTMKSFEIEGSTSLKPGLYFAYFLTPHEPSSLMRSLIVVRSDSGITSFRRLTGRSEAKGSWWSHFRGDHRGIVVERRHWLYFVAMNQVGCQEPTLLVLRWLTHSEAMLSGHASILNPSGPVVTAVVLKQCPPRMTLRAAIRASHVLSSDDPTLDPIIVDTLEEQSRSLLASVRRLDLSVQPVTEDERSLW